MAAIADAGHSGRARWILTALLRRLAPHPRTADTRLTAVTVSDDKTVRANLRPRHHYPAQRDRFFERSAMAREMYRL